MKFSALSWRLILGVLAGGWRLAAEEVRRLASPDGVIAVEVRVTDRIRYDVAVDGTTVMKDATMALAIDAARFGEAPKVRAATTATHDGMLHPVVRQKAAELREHYNELRLELEGGAAVTFRAYDEGVAYRWETTLPGDKVTVRGEDVMLKFADNYFVHYPEEESFFSHNERFFTLRALGDLAAKNLASIPAIVDAHGVKLAICDADVDDYPGLWLQGTSGSALAGTFPPYALEEKLDPKSDRDLRVTKTADYLAVTKGTRTFPWRVIGVARKDAQMLANPLVWLLAKPTTLTDTAWIKPGKVAWDWWNANNFAGVDFKAGVNTATYKAYIDFAAEHGLDYVILDEGWYALGDVLSVVPEVDVPALASYGQEKKVGLILWVVAKSLEDKLDAALDQFAAWGVKGIKVDFMQRDDQRMMNFYARVSAAAAQRKMLVDFHGAIRPALLTRTWPNLISTEGVRGNEWNKWSDHITPTHTATLPFTRMFVGPMDFTPGGMRNETEKWFSKNNDRPMTQGTRCRQLAMYVVYESPLQMLADSPTNYRREPECMAFLSAVPTEWDETRPLDGRIGEFVVVARRNGEAWWVGAMTDWTARDLTIDLSFLPEGNFVLEAWQDGINADRWAEDFKQVKQTVTRATKLTVHLAPGGGWAARLRKE